MDAGQALVGTSLENAVYTTIVDIVAICTGCANNELEKCGNMPRREIGTENEVC